MADPKKRNDIDAWNSDTNKSIYADHLGLTPQFIKENEDRLKQIEKTVQNALKITKEDDPNHVLNTMKQLQDINKATFVSDSRLTNLDSASSMYGETGPVTKDGFKMVYGELENREDGEIFNFHASIFSNYRNLVSEYRNIARLIPSVDRCADMKSRDILSINEITKRAVCNIYIPGSDTDNAIEIDAATLHKNPINKTIESDIIDRYKVEEKLKRYFKTAFIEGAKPVAVFPFRDIMDMAKSNIAKYKQNYDDFNAATSGNEGWNEDIVRKYHERDHRLVEPLREKFVHKVHSSEGLETETVDQEGLKKYRDSVINRFLSSEDLNEYMKRGVEDVHDYLEKKENDEVYDIYGKNYIDDATKIEETKQKYRDLHGKVKIDGSLSEHFKNQIFNAIQKIDANIDFYDQSEIAIGAAINNVRRLMQFTGGYHEDPKYGIIGYGDSQKSIKKLKDEIPFYDQDPIRKFDDPKKKEFKSVLDIDGDNKDEALDQVLNDCLIKEYDAEDVIPIIISGRHVGYYAIETSPYTGNVESVNKRNCNFTDIFINLGFQNDMMASPTPSNTGAFSNGVRGAPIGGAGPISDTPTLGVTGNGSISMAGSLDLAGFDMLGNDDAVHRNNIMKKIIFNVLKQKIKYNDLDDDDSFSDTIMSLIRDGAIIQSKVKIIYIPEKYMCYFTPELDGNGIPQSFLKNCLYTCYERIAVDLNNIMTRLTRTGTKDKITINIGKAKSMGRSIRAIENALTTRQLNTESPFTSLSRVLKASSLTETIIVPVFDGEKLFEYEQLNQTNRVEPQDDLVQKLDNDIVTALKCPITITNPYQEEDFASMAASRNAEYRFDVIVCQKRFQIPSEKFIKLLIVGSGLYERLRNKNDTDVQEEGIVSKFNLKMIHLTFSPPEALNLQHNNDLFGTVSTYVDNIINLVIDPNDDTEDANWKKFEFKKNLYQKLMPGLGLDEYINTVADLKKEATVQSIKKRKDRSVNDQIVNTHFEPLLANSDGEVVKNHSGDGNESDNGW